MTTFARPQEIEAKNKVFFCVQVLNDLNGRQLKALRPDEDGYYSVVLAVLDATSRNRTFYDVDSIIREITDPKTVFNQMLTQGNLRGEYGHPSKESSLDRIGEILEDRVAFHISKIWTGEKLENGGIPVYGKIRPCGPHGKYVEQSLLNPKENTTFSLRCLMTQKVDTANNRLYRTVKQLITFDYVNMPGYLEASKWYSPATEGFIHEIQPEDVFFNENTKVGFEHWSDRDLADLFGMKEFVVKELRGMYHTGTGNYYDNKGCKHSIVHALLRK